MRNHLARISAPHRWGGLARCLAGFATFVVVGTGSQVLGADPPAPYAWGLGGSLVVGAAFTAATQWVGRKPSSS